MTQNKQLPNEKSEDDMGLSNQLIKKLTLL